MRHSFGGLPGWNRRTPECRPGARGRPAGPAHSSSRFANRRTLPGNFGAEFPVWHRELLGPGCGAYFVAEVAAQVAQGGHRLAPVFRGSFGGVGEFEIAVEVEDVAQERAVDCGSIHFREMAREFGVSLVGEAVFARTGGLAGIEITVLQGEAVGVFIGQESSILVERAVEAGLEECGSLRGRRLER